MSTWSSIHQNNLFLWTKTFSYKFSTTDSIQILLLIPIMSFIGSLTFIISIFKKSIAQLFYRIWLYLMFSHDWIWILPLWQEKPRSDVLFVSLHSITRHTISICLITIYFDHLVKVVSARLLHCRVTLFSFVINKYFVGKYFEKMWIYTSASNFQYNYPCIYICMNSWIPVSMGYNL